MPQLPLPLPTNRGRLWCSCVPSPPAPLAWDGRAEHVGLRAGDTLLLAGRVTGVHVPRPGGGAGPRRHGACRSIWGMSASFTQAPGLVAPVPGASPLGVLQSEAIPTLPNGGAGAGA